MQKEIPKLYLEIARQRVIRGVKWFDQRAETDLRFRGWRLEMMSIYGGNISSHVCICRDNENPLALVLKWEKNSHTGFYTHVTWATVCDEFGFGLSQQSTLKAQMLGFHEGYYRERSFEIRNSVEMLLYCYALDQAWAEALGEHRAEHAVYPYRETPAMWPLPEIEKPKKGLFRRLLAA